MARLGVYLAAITLVAGVVQAAVTLWDFESDGHVAAWRLRAPQQDKLARSERFATSGQSSMVFTTPVWREGMGEWPAFEAQPPVADWREYDRLVVDITNPDDAAHFLALFISDSKVPFREGLSYRFELPRKGFRRFVVPLGSFPEKVDRADIAIVHFFTQRPESDMQLYVDGLVLLKPGETLAEPPPSFVRQVAGLVIEGLSSAEESIAACREAVVAIADTPELRRRAEAEIGKMTARVEAVRRDLAAPDLTLARLEELSQGIGQLVASPERVVSAVSLQRDFDALGFPDTPIVVGFASSMEKVLPRDMPYRLTVSRRVRLELARNEKESFQVAVTPREGAAKGVRVRVGDLKSATGEVFSARHIDCDVVGYVETKKRPPYQVSYVGWWPDPILDFLGPVDIAEGDVQTFWVRVRAPKDQAPGVYRGELAVSAEGWEPITFELVVRVYPFTLPDHTPLPTAITFFERPAQMGGEENWATMKLVYADFLADYYIDYDSLYRSGPPDFEIVTRLHDQGRLVAFNLGNVFNSGTTEEGFDQAIAQTVERLRPGYEEAKALGLLNHAYIYGFDERPKEQFPLLERSAQALRQAFPEVLLMTTSYDDSYGLESVVKTIDAWCPLTPSFDPEKAARARAAGKKVWWYICCGPHNPYANWFVEYAAIDARLLMGAMTAKQRPDGFLYYSLTIWNQNRPIETGPFTAWDPVSWTTYHGDGSLMCSGPGGKPVPTIRLENYRDGMEDFAYACILGEIVRRYEARGEGLSEDERAWLESARRALAVPEGLVAAMNDYSRDPKDLNAWRNRIARVIEASGVTDANPWGEDFGVRGFTGH